MPDCTVAKQIRAAIINNNQNEDESDEVEREVEVHEDVDENVDKLGKDDNDSANEMPHLQCPEVLVMSSRELTAHGSHPESPEKKVAKTEGVGTTAMQEDPPPGQDTDADRSGAILLAGSLKASVLCILAITMLA